MRRVRIFAAQLGLGIGAVYAFFLIPDIAELFRPSFLILLRQVLALSFGVCLLLNPSALAAAGAKYGPKVIEILSLFFSNKSKKDES